MKLETTDTLVNRGLGTYKNHWSIKGPQSKANASNHNLAPLLSGTSTEQCQQISEYVWVRVEYVSTVDQ